MREGVYEAFKKAGRTTDFCSVVNVVERLLDEKMNPRDPLWTDIEENTVLKEGNPTVSVLKLSKKDIQELKG